MLCALHRRPPASSITVALLTGGLQSSIGARASTGALLSTGGGHGAGVLAGAGGVLGGQAGASAGVVRVIGPRAAAGNQLSVELEIPRPEERPY
jgi:hypothetical protein